MLPASSTYPSFNSGGPSQQQTITSTVAVAPVLGIQSNKTLYEMDPKECIFAYNIIPKEYGMEIRRGYTYFADIDDNNEVRTIMEFPDGIENTKIFAATLEGIYDITEGGEIDATSLPGSGEEGEVQYAWPTPTGQAGTCSYAFYSNASGNHLLVCDEVNGYIRYSASGGWVEGGMDSDPTGAAGPINGDASLVHVCEYKQRLWFTEKNTGRAYYTAAGAFSGASVPFEFGTKFTHGGNLRALYNWTIDGGNGVDDYLLAVGDSGDLLVYNGIDPSEVTSFSAVGNWYVGELPAGRRIGSNFGGEFLLLCAGGLVSVTKLLRGADIGENTAYLTYNIARLIRNTLNSYSTFDGWHITLFPKENLLIVTSPEVTYNLQFVMNLSTKAWAMTRDVPALCSAVYDRELYFGDRTGGIWIQSGYTDPVWNPSTSEYDTTEIDWSFLGSYQGMGSPAAFKRMQLVRPLFMSSGVPSYSVQARYDFDISEFIGGTLTSPPTPPSSLWDDALWDFGYWSDENIVTTRALGAKGMGRYLALAVRGRSGFLTQYGGADVMWDTGGLL